MGTPKKGIGLGAKLIKVWQSLEYRAVPAAMPEEEDVPPPGAERAGSN